MSKGTDRHAFRLSDDLWTACVAKAERTGESITDVVRERLEQWITEDEETETMSDKIENVEPVKGMAATIHLVSDSLPAVVVRVNAKSITVARVAVDEDEAKRVRINDEREPYPCYAQPGILTEVIGTPERYTRIEHSDGRVSYRCGSIGLSLGKAVRVTDYRY